MPSLLTRIIGVIALKPLLALFLQAKLGLIALQIVIFGVIFTLFKQSMQFIMDLIFTKLGTLEFPCMVSYILNELDVFPMLNFGLSLWATIYIGRYLLTHLMKLV